MYKSGVIERISNTDKNGEIMRGIGKNGQQWERLNILLNGEWLSGFKDEVSATWHQGLQVTVRYSETVRDGKVYKNYRTLSGQALDIYRLEMRLDEIERRLAKASSAPKDLPPFDAPFPTDDDIPF